MSIIININNHRQHWGIIFAEILALHFFYKVGKLIDFYVMTTVQEQTLNNNCTMHNGGVVVEQQIITSYSNPTPTRLYAHLKHAGRLLQISQCSGKVTADNSIIQHVIIKIIPLNRFIGKTI